MARLKNLVVLLTGASRGIGSLIAEAVARHGAAMALTARSFDGLQETADRLRAFGTETLLVPADVTAASEREELVAKVHSRYGRIDVLINNAGIETEGSYVDLPWSAIVENVAVNLVAPMALVHLVLPGMLQRRAGHIVNIASIAAKSGAPYDATYSGTKAALAQWTRALRLELRGTGVRFTTVFPGYVRDVGMFARFGMTPPFLVGSCAAPDVARAVVRAIERRPVEMIVNSRPLRYAYAINELLPSFGDWLMRLSGAVEFQRRKVGK